MYKALRFTLVSLLMMLCGTVLAQEESPEISLDFTSQTAWNIPTSGTNKDLATFTNGTYSIKLYATTNYKMNSGYLILGKKDSYLELPAFDFSVAKIVVTGREGASAAVVQNVYVGDVPVSTATTGATSANTYEIAEAYQAAGNIYKLVVTSAHNTQITKIEVYNAAAGDEPTTKTVTFVNDAEWAEVYVWAWNDTENFTGGTWPGVKIEPVEGVYTWSTTGEPTSIIFNNGSSGEGNQTENLAFEDGATYNSKGKVVPLKDFSVTFSTNLGWEKVYAYAWTDETPIAAWPGTEITETLTDGVYTYAFQATEAPANVIFNDGTQEGGVVDKNQTADLDFVNGKKYVYIVSSAEAPLTVAQAVAAIDAGIAATDEVFVEGIVSQVDSYNSSYKSITYWISTDGTTENQFEVYSGKGLNGADFATKDDVEVGAKVIVKGAIKKYGDIYEFDKNNQLVKYEAPAPVAKTYTATFTTNKEWADVYAYTWTIDGENKVEQLGEWPGTKMTKDEETGIFSISFEVTGKPANIIFNNGLEGDAKEQTADLAFENEKKYVYIVSSADAPLTVAQAVSAIDAGIDVTDEVFVEGIISQIDSYNDTYHSITYWISADGTTENQFEVYSGKGIDGADFTSVEDIKVGAKVIVKGGIKKYNDTYEFDKSNQLVKYEAPLNTYTATFTTNAGWEKVYAYAWTTTGEDQDAVTTEFLGAWPGTELEAVEGVYTVTVKAEAAPANIIFNNGQEGDAKQQTEDLAFEDGKAYTYDVPAQTATFDFASADIRENIGTAMTDTKGYIYNETFTADGVTLQITAGSAPSRIYVDPNRDQCLVIYPQYATLTFKAPENKAITKIEFTAAGNSNINKFTASSGAIEGMIWTGNVDGVRFTQGATSYLANAIVTLADKDAETTALPAIEYTEVANIAAFNALEAGTYAKITLTDAEVIGKSADGYSTVWVQDATGGAWIQYTSLNDKLQEKTKINGTIYTIKRVASGNPQVKEAEDTPNSEFTSAAIDAYTIVEGTIDEVNVAENLNKVVKINGATLAMTSTMAGTLTLGESTIAVNNGAETANQQLHKIADWEKDKTLENIIITAILVAKSATENQLLPISIEVVPVYNLVGCFETWTGEDENVIKEEVTVEGLFATKWDAENAEDPNVMVYDEETGNYTLSFTNIELPGKGNILYKVVKNHSWAESYGTDTNGNCYYWVNEAGKYDITFTLNLKADTAAGNWLVSCNAVKSITDGIANIKAAQENGAAIYTLQGVRVNNVKKGGLYIVNGRKIAVK